MWGDSSGYGSLFPFALPDGVSYEGLYSNLALGLQRSVTVVTGQLALGDALAGVMQDRCPLKGKKPMSSF